jgi:PHP family Zn ribbon phosphoesterase/transcriptional regulator with XRE-family HTH domain
MKEFNLDLHFHSPFAGGVSKNMSIPILAEQARLKGLHCISTADITHPEWMKHLKQNLIEENGIYRHEKFETKFIVGTEIQSEQQIHHLIYLEDLGKAEELAEKLKPFGRLDYYGAGRPKLRISPEKLAEIVANLDGLIGPAHAFTPYFGVYAHFDSIQKAYGSFGKEIKFLELGLSADSSLADLIEENHKYNFFSFSDAHCVHPESLITLANGQLMPIKEIWEKKEPIACFDFENNKTTFALPKAMKKKSPAFLIEINANSKKLNTTPEHRLFTLAKNNEVLEKFASELKENDWIAINNKTLFFERQILIEEPKHEYYFKLSKNSLAKLKEKRENSRITQNEMGKKLGLKDDYYWRLEKGQYKINEKTFSKIRELLNIGNAELETEKLPNIKFPKKLNNEKLCQILGYVLGDGCHEKGRKGDQLGLTDKEKGMLEFYSMVIEELFGETRAVSEKDKMKNSYRLRLSQKILEFFENIDKELLAKSKNRRVPEKVFWLGKKETAAFIRGFFDAEGCFGNHDIDACSASEFLMKQIQSLLLKFEINSSIYKNFEKTKKKYRYRLHIYGQKNLKTFQDNIGFSHSKKKEKLEKYLKRMIQKPKNSLLKFHDNILWAKINSISKKKSDCEFVYDLSIDGFENYVVEGFITHNSPWPHRLGREFVRVLMKEPSFKELKKALNFESERKITLNVGLDPREGKYHETACNACYTHYSLKEAEAVKWHCSCGGQIKKGVKERILELANFKEENHPLFRPDYLHLIPLAEIIQLTLGERTPERPAVQELWKEFVQKFGTEINALVDAPIIELMEVHEGIAKRIESFRKGLVVYKPGGGGDYGKPFICLSESEFEEKKLEITQGRKNKKAQKTLFEY